MLRRLVPPLAALLVVLACRSEAAPPAAPATTTSAAAEPAGPIAAPPKVGDPAPDFAVKDHTGATLRLADLKGKQALFWFYPKAMTGG